MKIASIDIGTNTVILLIAEIRNNNIVPLINEYRVPRIGKSIESSKYISHEKITELIHVLSEFNDLIKSFGCEVVLAYGTNAFRLASNSLSIIQTIREMLGIQINIVTSLQEAKYSFLGAVSNISNKDNDNLVIDIGGGSTELIYGRINKITYINSFQAGVVSGTERFFKNDPPLPSEIKEFETYLSSSFEELEISKNVNAIAIAGTPTTLSCIQKGLSAYNEDEIEGSVLIQADVYRLIKELSLLSSRQIKEKYIQIVSGREDVLLAGTIILNKIMKILKLTKVIVSTKGIRYGAIADFIKTNNY
jgi:exopolyphosphatase / guanosine-5'-triphosphate,3'-diphosphate pyrophosphatase